MRLKGTSEVIAAAQICPHVTLEHVQGDTCYSTVYLLFQITYIFSHDPKGPEELSFRLRGKFTSILHTSEP